MSVNDLAAILKGGDRAPLRIERGTVVPDVTPSPAHCRVQLADGLVVSAVGAASPGADVTLLVGDGIVMLLAPPRVGVSATRTSGQSIGSATHTAITWTAETIDTHGFITPTSSTITIRQAGTYAVSCNVDVNIALGGRCYLQVAVAGSRALTVRAPFTSPGEDKASVAVTLPLSVGDTVTAAFFQSSGNTASLTGAIDVWRVAW